MSLSKLVLATGVNGYLGAHVVDQLVKHGYRVRGTVRSSKLAASRKSFASYGDAVEIVAVDDLINGVFPEIFKGVDAVIHSASPLPGREATPEAALDVAEHGSVNILSQAEKAGIKDFSYASSVASHSVGNMKGDINRVNEDDWLPVTREAVLADPNADPMLVYAVEKTLAEKAVWAFVDKHPHIEMLTLSPSFFYGPFAPGHRSPFEGDSFSPNTISTESLFYGLLKPSAALPPLSWVDVRDVARALVEALKAPPTSQVGRKRLLLCGEYHHANELTDLIRRERPQLAHRLNQKAESAPKLGQTIFNERFNQILKFELVPWKKTILDATDALVELENYWKAQGKPIYNDA